MAAPTPRDSSYDLAPSQPSRLPSKTQDVSATARTQLGPQRSCPYCGFAFHGPPKARCPECSAPLDSGQSDLLKFADVQWCRRIANGTLLIVLAFLGHLFAAFLRWISDPATESLAHAAAAILMTAAVFIATLREPTPKPASSRVALSARYTAIAAALFWCMLCLILTELLPASRGIIKTLVLLALVAHATLAMLLNFHFSALAARLPDDDLARHATNSGGVTAIACGLLFGVQFLELTTIVHFMFFFCSFPLIAGVLTIFFWAMVTLLRIAIGMRVSANAGAIITSKRLQRLSNANRLECPPQRSHP